MFYVHLVDSPGIVVMVPTRGYRNPAPTEALTSRIGMVNPVGAPFFEASDDSDRWVLAMQIGSLENPCLV